MSFIQFRTFSDLNGDHIVVARPDGHQQARLIIPNGLKNSATFSSTVDSLHGSVVLFAKHLEGIVDTLSPKGMKEKVPALIGPSAFAFKALSKVAVARRDEVDAIWRDIAYPKFNDSAAEAIRRCQIRDWLRGMKSSVAFKAAFSDREINAAVLEAPAVAGLQGELVENLRNRFAVQTFSEKFAQMFTRIPSATAPIASGVDFDKAAMKAAEAIVNIGHSRSEIADVGALLRSTIEFAAVSGDVNHEQAFEMLAA